MLIVYFSDLSVPSIVVIAIQILSYMRILSKMGKNPLKGIIPVVAEHDMAGDLFRYMRSFWRPVVVTGCLFLTAMYLKTNTEVGLLLRIGAFVIYGIFLARLYWRLAKRFGKGKLFALGMIFLPPLILPILGFGRSRYLGRVIFPERLHLPLPIRALKKAVVVVISAVELTALVAGCGWLYTLAFGQLAKDPAMSTQDFGKALVGSYDPMNSMDGEAKPDTTLSLVDLTLVGSVKDRMEDIFVDAAKDMQEDRGVFANISAARANAYQFSDEEQVDLVDFLQKLKSADYKEQVATDASLDELIDATKACVVYRNRDSAEGINGISTDFPYKNIYNYNDGYAQYKKLKLKKQIRFFNNFCSIMACSQENEDKGSALQNALATNAYIDQEWYVKGYEDYDTSKLFIDKPVKQVEKGYVAELPEKTWDTVIDSKVAPYMVTDKGLMCLGKDFSDAGEEEGHPVVAMGDSWIGINGHLVSYEAEQPMETKEGIVHKGTVKGRMGHRNITIHVQWDPVKATEDGEAASPVKGTVNGYSIDDKKILFFMEKGLEQFKSGDKIDFMFEYYDEKGELIKTAKGGDPLRVVKEESLTVEEVSFETGTEISWYGVYTDIYQRELMTEEIREKVE